MQLYSTQLNSTQLNSTQLNSTQLAHHLSSRFQNASFFLPFPAFLFNFSNPPIFLRFTVSVGGFLLSSQLEVENA